MQQIPPTDEGGVCNLAAVNSRFESTGELPPSIWTQWLWDSNAEEPFTPDVLLNRNQLLGILVCRYKHRHARDGGRSAGGGCGRLSLMDKEASAMSWRELKDTLSNVQIEWPEFMQRLGENRRAGANLLSVKGLIDGCAARFGSLCERAWGVEVLDDPADAQPPPPGAQGAPEGARVLTPSAMRRTTGTLLILYRHLHLLAVAQSPGPETATTEVPEIMQHHYEASMSDFYLWYMHFQLPAAAKLNYKHDFPGMYNHVTQPVYFHNPGFERLPRRLLHDHDPPAIHTLPSVCQLYPELTVRFEEDDFDPTKDSGWYWLIVSGRVYLVGSGPRVFYSPDTRSMLCMYLAERAA
jgi:hypothetical protein